MFKDNVGIATLAHVLCFLSLCSLLEAVSFRQMLPLAQVVVDGQIAWIAQFSNALVLN